MTNKEMTEDMMKPITIPRTYSPTYERDQCIKFVEYVLLENGMITDKFSKAEKKIMEEEWSNFIKDQKND